MADPLHTMYQDPRVPPSSLVTPDQALSYFCSVDNPLCERGCVNQRATTFEQYR